MRHSRRMSNKFWYKHRDALHQFLDSRHFCALRSTFRQCHRELIRRQLHWLPIRQRITYKLAVITNKTSTGNPAYLSHLIHDYQPARTLRSSDKLLLVILSVPRTTLTLSAKAFSVSALIPSGTHCQITADLLMFLGPVVPRAGSRLTL